MKKNQNKIIFIIHKFLAKKTYFFKFIKKSDFVLNLYYINFYALIKSNIDNILITNFEKSFIKIQKKTIFQKNQNVRKIFFRKIEF